MGRVLEAQTGSWTACVGPGPANGLPGHGFSIFILRQVGMTPSKGMFPALNGTQVEAQSQNIGGPSRSALATHLQH